MKFYVAAYAGERDRVAAVHRRLREAGHAITVDWTDLLDVADDERDAHPQRVAAVATRDLGGVADCDVFILLSDPPDGRAKYAELGAAIMSSVLRGRPKVYVVGEQTHHSVFFYHPAVTRARSIDEVPEI